MNGILFLITSINSISFLAESYTRGGVTMGP